VITTTFDAVSMLVFYADDGEAGADTSVSTAMLMMTTGGSSDGAGGARRGLCCWLALRSPRRRRDAKARNCERSDRQQDGPNAPGWVASEERAAMSVRRAGGEATLRALASGGIVLNLENRVPEVSLRRRRVLLVAARSSPCGAARGNAQVT